MGDEDSTTVFRKWHLLLLVLVACQCILGAIAEAIAETLILTGVTPHAPFRFEFLSLKLLSTILSIQTVWGILKKEVDFTKNSLFAGIFLELAMIASDIQFLIAPEVQDIKAFVLAYRSKRCCWRPA